MKFVAEIVWQASESARARRAAIFKNNLLITAQTKILDLGSEDGSNIAGIIANTEAKPENVFIADIDPKLINRGHVEYGFNPVLLSENGKLPFADKFFDVVYCSSVIEHVTVPKEDVWKLQTDFEIVAAKRQREFAAEIIRIGKQYFVQTPAKYFLVESHSWLPLINLLPRALLIPLLQITNKYWIKQTIPDFRLLNQRQMKNLFPNAQIICETTFGITKSFMAIKK